MTSSLPELFWVKTAGCICMLDFHWFSPTDFFRIYILLKTSISSLAVSNALKATYTTYMCCTLKICWLVLFYVINQLCNHFKEWYFLLHEAHSGTRLPHVCGLIHGIIYNKYHYLTWNITVLKLSLWHGCWSSTVQLRIHVGHYEFRALL